jgi:hypothetical protein
MLKAQIHDLILAVLDMPTWPAADGRPAVAASEPGGPMTAQALRRVTLELFVMTRLRGLELEVTEALIKDMITRLGPGWPPVEKTEWDQFAAEFSRCLQRETQTRVYLYLPREKQPYYVEESAEAKYPSPEIALAFPSARYDLIHASRCYACDEGTAAVFHAMRALEVVVRLLAKRLKVRVAHKGKPLAYEDIGNVLRAIHSKVEGSLPNAPGAKARKGIRGRKRGPVKEKMLTFYQTAALQLDRSIDIWRHPVAHSRTKYGTDDALGAIQATHDLLAHLAANGMKEPR